MSAVLSLVATDYSLRSLSLAQDHLPCPQGEERGKRIGKIGRRLCFLSEPLAEGDPDSVAIDATAQKREDIPARNCMKQQVADFQNASPHVSDSVADGGPGDLSGMDQHHSTTPVS